jgi:hypothetical protein
MAAMDYFDKLIPMSASFLADAELLAQYRAKMSQVAAEAGGAVGPQKVEDLLATYLEEEKQLGRLPACIASREVAMLLLGACFQFAYLHHLLGTTPSGKTREQFIEELIRGMMSSILPA